MGVGDRHSRRTDKSRIAIPAIRSIAAESSAIAAESSADDRELDDPFSAWDEDDAGVHRPSPASQLAAAAQTRMERKASKAAAVPSSTVAAPPVLADGSSRRITTLGEPLVDPVAMRDIVISRARTLDDPLTTRVLAEIARKQTRSNIAIVPPESREAPPDEPELGERPTMKLTPLRLPAAMAAEARSEIRTATRSYDTLAAAQAPQPIPPASSDTRATREEIPSPNRRGSRRPIARDEPFRK